MRPKPRVPMLLEALLRAHKTEEGLLSGPIRFKVLGSGCERTAYLVLWGKKRFVVKRRNRNTLKFRGNARVRKAPTKLINGWQVQHYYKKAAHSSEAFDKKLSFVYGLRGDLGHHNCGLDTDGSLVAYDW